jgi:hypothetical protein
MRVYSEDELDQAVRTGAIDQEAAQRLRASVAAQRGSTPADDENFRLVTGFNDVFVTIAAALVLYSTNHLVGGLIAAGVAWLLAEHFTRRKHMALPSIFLLLWFAGGLLSFLTTHLAGSSDYVRGASAGEQGVRFFLGFTLAAAITAAATYAHWRRFRVPITVAVGTTTLALVVLSIVATLFAASGMDGRTVMKMLQWLVFVAGVAIFAFAMRWDLSDPERTTRRSDVAFWLHLVASPMIVHPIFLEIARFGRNVDAQVPAAILALLVYAGLGVLALIVDRRAVLVSALAYAVFAVAVVFGSGRGSGLGNSAFVSAAVTGALLLAMSVFWRDLRRALIGHLPENLRIRLPEAAPTRG